MYKDELLFEKDFVTALTEHGWSKDIIKNPTEEDLIRNWANILFNNNKGIDRLNGQPLTDGEMAQLIEQINRAKTPFQLNKFINGKTVTIKRDNPLDTLHYGKEVSLFIYDRDQIAGGRSTYQIVEQPVFKAKTSILPNRRGDVMLLIGGMPVIHIELKRSGVSYTQAVNQIEKYVHEGVFTGLFSLVQVFVAMMPEKTVYFANPGEAKFNPKFQFEWADFFNEPYHDWNKVVTHLLSIPMAHKLIGFYTVPDDTDGILKVMRSYQYNAVEAINNRVDKAEWTSKDKKGGYIFHTTGSGKTMTSFKAAQLISSSKKVEKVVFLMDRIELGTQSAIAYRNFASETEEIQETENTSVLITKLKSDYTSDTLIVSSIQKMSNIEVDAGVNIHDIEKINRKKMVFIIDECHRSTFGDMLTTIKRTFPNALYFGFTGTPIYEENQKQKSTTADVFGNELHRYSVADGIRDGNVLGFDPIMVTTFQDNDIKKAVALAAVGASSFEEIAGDERKQEKFYHYMALPMASDTEDCIEKHIPVEQYAVDKSKPIEDTHPYKVATNILSDWLMNSRNRKFSGILATSSIVEAISYYQLFKKLMGKNGLPTIKIAALFDESIDNNGTGIIKEDGIVEMLTDYNEIFGQRFSIPTYQKYKKDLAWRLAHKELYAGIEKHPEKQLDLLIVVDQMLTGFDSKWVNILYLDKVLKNEGIIQAFSRTNRIFGYDKPHGIVKWYRYPHTMKLNMEKAFELYSGNKPFGIFVDKLGSNLKAMNGVYAQIKQLFINNDIHHFEKNPDSTAAKAKFAKLYIELNKFLDAAKIQEFVWEKLEYEDVESTPPTKISLDFDERTYLILALRYKELFSVRRDGDSDEDSYLDDTIPFDIDPHLIEIDTEKIDADYLNSRFKKYVKTILENGDTDRVLRELHNEFASLSMEEQKYAEMVIHDIQNGDLTVSEDKTFRDYINAYSHDTKASQIKKFATTFGMDEVLLREIMSLKLEEKSLNDYGRFDAIIESGDVNKYMGYFNTIKPFAMQKIREFTRRFVLGEGFDI